MFTGIVEEIGEVLSVRKGAASAVITIKAETVLSDIKLGDSVAVNGVCLTTVAIGNHSFSADVMHETLRRTGLSSLKAGSRVNLERAMAADGRFGGHIVSGHVDGTGVIRSMKKDDNAVWITVDTEPAVLKYIIEKGSVAIDGISLTVAGVTDNNFSVSIIPHTGKETTLLEKGAGDTVNLENDLVGKYVEKLLSFRDEEEKPESRISLEFLAEHGF